MGAFEDLQHANDDDRVILGLKPVSGIIPRRDIDIVCRDDPDILNLFILALVDLQDETMTENWMGYFQIAGVKGYRRSANALY